MRWPIFLKGILHFIAPSFDQVWAQLEKVGKQYVIRNGLSGVISSHVESYITDDPSAAHKGHTDLNFIN